MVDQLEVASAHNFMHRAIRLGEQIVILDLQRRREPGERVTDAARGGVVTLAIASGEDQNSFHGRSDDVRRGATRSNLMDI